MPPLESYLQREAHTYRLCSALTLGCFVREVRLGVGEHIVNPHFLGNMMTISHWQFYHNLLIVVGISSVKISVGFFLLRLVQGRWYKVCFSRLLLRLQGNKVSNFLAINNCMDRLPVPVHGGKCGHIVSILSFHRPAI